MPDAPDDGHGPQEDLRVAGANAVDVNAPMGPDRLAAVAAELGAALGPEGVDGTAVDLGCGHGALATAMARAAPAGATVTGVDLDADLVERARARAAAAGVADRCRFVVGDAADVTGPHGVMTCVGAAHALGGIAAATDHLLERTARGGLALVADGIWASAPDAWCREAFGDLPGRAGLVDLAQQVGWVVLDVDESSLEEWDTFEEGWTAGVESVGTAAARAFAAERRAQYGRYRGVLGFAWLLLQRPT